ncbi:MAG: peptidoglycan DD-metalloendopeptidase family protein [Saprospiraceae bacterium]|nr:peptidoglycan DD-metalloendopeptidase family protein [Saprospiraceae bacterium]
MPSLPSQSGKDKYAFLPSKGKVIKNKKYWLFLIIFALLVFVLFFEENVKVLDKNIPSKNTKGGSQRAATEIDLSQYETEIDIFRENITLNNFLKENQLKTGTIANLLEQADKMQLTLLRQGHEIRRLKPKPGVNEPFFFIYEKSPDTLVYIHPFPQPLVKLHLQVVERKTAGAGIVLKNTLWDALYNNHLNPRLIEQMEDAMKWSVDFYHLQPGDRFKIIFDEVITGGVATGVGQLQAIMFDTQQGQYYAFLMGEKDGEKYLDEFGRSVRRTYLKSPVKYGRISSGYDLNRLHPVLNEVRPHFGTDYAAPKGDPIYAVSDGTVEVATFTSNNGNYVKIRHDKVYESQYLHMNNFADGITAGVQVRQGQVIGFVGETGLATGPHVCFRFWKNGKQVDHLKENLNKPEELNLQEEEQFLEKKSEFLKQLKDITYSGRN